MTEEIGISPTPGEDSGGGIKMLVFGEPGVGKTRLITTRPNTLIIRPPGDSLDAVEDPSNYEQITVTDWADMNNVFEWGQHGNFAKYDWVWLDSLSLWQDYGLDDVFQDAVDRKPSRAEYGPDQGEYGINMRRIEKWIRDVSGIADTGAFNFGITCHPFEWYHPVKEEDVFAPWIQGKGMVPKITGYMKVVAYLMNVEAKEGKSAQQVLLTDAKGFFGKDQYFFTTEFKSGRRGMVAPSMPKIEKAIKEARAKKSASEKKTTKKTTTRRRRTVKKVSK